VKLFFHDNLKGQDERSISQALESIEMNIDWLKNNQKELVDWLKKKTNNQSE
jgi:fructose-1-phosphate kinase PfkB-like protein